MSLCVSVYMCTHVCLMCVEARGQLKIYHLGTRPKLIKKKNTVNMSALSHRVTSYMWRRRTTFWNRFSPFLSLPCGGFQKSTSAAPLHLHFTRFWVCNPGFPVGKVRTWLTEPSPIFCPTLEVSFLELPPDSEYLSVFQESIWQTLLGLM